MADVEPGKGGQPPGAPSAPGPLATHDAYQDYYHESYETYVRWVRKTFKALTREDAEDVVAEAFGNEYAGRERILDPNPYFHTVIGNRARNVIKRKRESPLQGSLADAAEAVPSPLRPPDSEYASQECRELFSDEAVATLNPAQRRLYDLYLEGKTYRQIAELLGRTYDQMKDAFKEIFVTLFDAMAKRVTLDAAALSGVTLKTPQAAEEAMGRLPRLLSQTVRLTYVDKLSPGEIAHRLKFASANEVLSNLDRALSALQRIYRQKMPEALEAALSRNRSRKKDEGER